MTGFNLPPGCNVSDLPGNSKAEQEAEAFEEALSEVVGVMEEVRFEKLLNWSRQQINLAFASGYQQAQADEAEAHEHKRNADHVDGYDRDDLGESPDY